MNILIFSLLIQLTYPFEFPKFRKSTKKYHSMCVSEEECMIENVKSFNELSEKNNSNTKNNTDIYVQKLMERYEECILDGHDGCVGQFYI